MCSTGTLSSSTKVHNGGAEENQMATDKFRQMEKGQWKNAKGGRRARTTHFLFSLPITHRQYHIHELIRIPLGLAVTPEGPAPSLTHPSSSNPPLS